MDDERFWLEIEYFMVLSLKLILFSKNEISVWMMTTFSCKWIHYGIQLKINSFSNEEISVWMITTFGFKWSPLW